MLECPIAEFTWKMLNMRIVLSVLLTITLCLCTSASIHAQPQRIGDFALLDHTGKFHQLSYFSDQQAVVLIAHTNDSALINTHRDALAQLVGQYAEQPIVFAMLNAQADTDRDRIAADAKQTALGIPVLVDETQLVAQSLQLTHTGEVLVIHPGRMTIEHRGSLDQLQRTGVALDAVMQGATIEPSSDARPSTGAAIQYVNAAPTGAKTPSYSRDIAPILKQHCVQCHHDGGIGPWSMNSHAMIQGWSPMIREVLMTQRMPPGQVDTHVSKPLLKVAGLSTAELQTLVSWINAGAPGDDQPDPLSNLQISKSRYSFGEPDLIYTIPAQEIPATGVVDYRYVPVELNLDRDVWVRAMEFIPGDPEVLHHVIAYVSSPADKTVRGRATGAAQGESVGGFAPGRPGDALRDDSGRLLKKGSNLLLQMHYTTSGKPSVDETEIGIFIYDEPPTFVMSGGVAGQRRFFVPPFEKEYPLEGIQEIERDAYLYDLMPHMHYRGKYMSYTAEYPDGSSELLLSVPKYNFNWQFNYALKEPLFLPAGSRIIARGAMDNSAQNRANPDPSKPVHFGLQTKHEMFFGFTTLRYVGDTPAAVAQDRQTTDSAAGG